MIDLSDYIGNDGFKNLKKILQTQKIVLWILLELLVILMIRIKLVKIVKYLKSKNYIICVNLMKFTILTNKQIISF